MILKSCDPPPRSPLISSGLSEQDRGSVLAGLPAVPATERHHVDSQGPAVVWHLHQFDNVSGSRRRVDADMGVMGGQEGGKGESEEGGDTMWTKTGNEEVKERNNIRNGKNSDGNKLKYKQDKEIYLKK